MIIQMWKILKKKEIKVYSIYFDNFRFLILKLKSYLNVFIILNNKFK